MFVVDIIIFFFVVVGLEGKGGQEIMLDCARV